MSKSCLLRFALYDSGNRDEKYWTWTDDSLSESTLKDFYYSFLSDCGIAGIVRSAGTITFYRFFEGGRDPQMRTGRRVLFTAWLAEDGNQPRSPSALWNLLTAEFWDEFPSMACQNPVPPPTWGTRKNVSMGKTVRNLPPDLKNCLNALLRQPYDAHLKFRKDFEPEKVATFGYFMFHQNTQIAQTSETANSPEITQTPQPTQDIAPRAKRKRFSLAVMVVMGIVTAILIFVSLRSWIASRNSDTEIDFSGVEYPHTSALVESPEDRERWNRQQLRLHREIRRWERWCQEVRDDVNLVLYQDASKTLFFEKYPTFLGKSIEDVKRWSEDECNVCSEALDDMETLSKTDFQKKYDSFLTRICQTYSEAYQQISRQLESRRQALDTMESDFQRVGEDLTLNEFLSKYPEFNTINHHD